MKQLFMNARRILNSLLYQKILNKCSSDWTEEKTQKSIPIIDHVSQKEEPFRSRQQGLILKYEFYSNDLLIGSLTTELWEEENLLLVQRIDAEKPQNRQGTAMVKWLVEHSSTTIQPVHVINGGHQFWIKMKRFWPDRIISKDLRCSDYWRLLRERS